MKTIKNNIKNLHLIVFIIIFFSCSSNMVVVKYKGTDNAKVYKISLQKGFKVKETYAGNEWKQKEYKYSDESVFYISDEDGNTSLNYDNIRNDKIQNDKSFMAFANKDTITLSGIDKKGRYWKNKFDGEVNIGYLNVPEDRKKEFDKLILSVKK